MTHGNLGGVEMHWKPWVATATVVFLGGGLVVTSLWSSYGGQQPQPGAAVAASLQPCGGEALAEDSFPPEPQLLATVPPSPGGTADAPGTADGRSEDFLPDEQAFAALQAREGASVLMSSFRTNFSHASPSQAANIALVARRLNGQVVSPGTVFSYNRVVGPYTERGGYGWGRMFVGDRIVPTIGGGVCQGASTLYNVVLLANLPVVQRHPHGLAVPYLPPGRDATVTDSGGLDFRFRNNSGRPLLLWAQAKDRWLSIALYGHTEPPAVRIHTEVLSRQPFQTLFVSDPKLAPGTERVVAAGQDGVAARTWIVVSSPNGPKTRDLGSHTYRPSPRIILRGPAVRRSSSAAPPLTPPAVGPSGSAGTGAPTSTAAQVGATAPLSSATVPIRVPA